MGELKVDHLNDVAEGLGDIDDAHRHQHQRRVQGKGQAAHRAPQKQGAGIPHEHLGRVEVIQQETHQGPGQRTGKHAQCPLLPPGGQHREEHRYRQRHRGSQAVHPVGKIH